MVLRGEWNKGIIAAVFLVQSSAAFANCAKSLLREAHLEIRLNRLGLGFSEAQQEIYVPTSLQEGANIEAFLKSHPGMNREILIEDLAITQKNIVGESLGFYLSLSSFAERNSYSMQSVIEAFLSIKETVLQIAEGQNTNPIQFGPRKAAINIYNSDILDLMDAYPEGLPENFSDIVEVTVQLGARSVEDIVRFIEVAQSFSLEELYFASAITSLRTQLSFEKRLPGIMLNNTERVVPTFRESLLLFGVMANVKELSKVSLLEKNLREYEARPHLNYELETFEDVLRILSSEYNFSISLE